MRILVPIKRVPDPNARIKVNGAGDGIETSGLRYEINPFDEIAVEEAVRIKEAGDAEIVVVSIGGEECGEQLRKALAIGADRGLLVLATEPLDSLDVARVLAKVVEREKPDLVIMGKQATDDDSNQAGQMLAALAGLPQATFASEIALSDGGATVTRETDEGQETLRLPLPAVVTTDLRLNEPRYVALPGIIKARSKPVETVPLADLGVSARCSVRVKAMRAPEARQAGRKVANVDELIAALRAKGALG